MRVAAIGDIHCQVDAEKAVLSLLEGVEREAEVLLLAGDLTDRGLPQEMETLLRCLRRITLPMVAVLGNHDHECDQDAFLVQMMAQEGIHVLKGATVEIQGVFFVGTKGFCGGFGNRSIQPFGEKVLKAFIQESINEAALLERELARNIHPHRVAILHFSPSVDTLQGEPREIHPFLGSSRLGDALDRYGVNFAVHSHSHNGYPEGRTTQGTPVYNVSRFVLGRGGERAYRLLDVG